MKRVIRLSDNALDVWIYKNDARTDELYSLFVQARMVKSIRYKDVYRQKVRRCVGDEISSRWLE